MIEQNENDSQEAIVHLWDYIHMLWHRKFLILVVSTIVISLGIFVSLMTPSSYTSTCKIRLKQSYELQEVQVYSKRYFVNEFWLNTELEVFQSKSIIKELVKNTTIHGVDLVTYYQNKVQPTRSKNICKVFGTTPSEVRQLLFGWLSGDKKKSSKVLTPEEIKELQLMQVVGKIQSMISINVSKESSVISVSVTCVANPEEAQVIANALPKAYESFKIRDKVAIVSKGLDEIRHQVAEKLENVNTLRTTLAGIREKYHITLSHEDPIKQVDPEAVNSVKITLMNAKIEMLLEEKTWEKIQGMQDSELSEAFGVLMNDSMGYLQLKNDLNNAIVQFKLLKIDFGQSHPKVKRAKVELEELTKQMAIRIVGIKSAMKLRYEKSVTKYNGIKVEYDQLANELSGERAVHIQQFNVVASDLIIAKNQLNSISQILSEKEVNQRLPRSAVEIISKALTPWGSSSPNHVKNLAVSVFLALALSVGLVFLLDYLDNTLKTVPQIEQVTGMNVIATIPYLSEKELETGHIFVEILNATSVSTARNNKVLSIHSSMPSEGKSTVCVKTAIESARAGNRVLIIDMDVRRPTVHKALKVKLESGIADALRVHTAADLATCVKETKYDRLSVVTAGIYKDDAPLTPRLMAEITEMFKDDYDLVILDCPPVAVVNESLIIADASDEVILVLRPNFTDVKQVKRAVSMLKGLSGHIVGVVANQVKKKSAMYYSSKFYDKYYS